MLKTSHKCWKIVTYLTVWSYKKILVALTNRLGFPSFSPEMISSNRIRRTPSPKSVNRSTISSLAWKSRNCMTSLIDRKGLLDLEMSCTILWMSSSESSLFPSAAGRFCPARRTAFRSHSPPLRIQARGQPLSEQKLHSFDCLEAVISSNSLSTSFSFSSSSSSSSSLYHLTLPYPLALYHFIPPPPFLQSC